MNILEQFKYVVTYDLEEYFKYLIQLEKKNHRDIIIKTLKLNDTIYPIDMTDLKKFSLEAIYIRAKLYYFLKLKPDFNNYRNYLESINPNFQEFLKISFPSNITLNEDNQEYLISELKIKSEEINYSIYKYFENQEETKRLNLIDYKHFLRLNSKNYFGDLALDRHDGLRYFLT